LKLQPKNFKHKRLFKNRILRHFNDSPFLKWGDIGLLILRPIQITSRRLSKFKLFLKRCVRKFDITARHLWFNAFPHLPLTKKTTNARMGKGKGKLNAWFTNVRGGIFLIEFLNVRHGRALYFMRQIFFRLGIQAIPFFKFYRGISFPFANQHKIKYKHGWF
jgi:large subunit ribosomal protein L16